MVAKFLDHNNRELKQDDGDGNENGKKSIGQGAVYMGVGDPR